MSTRDRFIVAFWQNRTRTNWRVLDSALFFGLVLKECLFEPSHSGRGRPPGIFTKKTVNAGCIDHALRLYVVLLKRLVTELAIFYRDLFILISVNQQHRRIVR